MPKPQTDLQRRRREMAFMLDAWEPNGNTPPDYVRRNGLGTEIAKVDVRCGNYQWSHTPKVIGWQALGHGERGTGNQREYDLLIVAEYGDKDTAINVAMAEADKALAKLGWKLPPDTAAKPKFVGRNHPDPGPADAVEAAQADH